MSPPVSAAVQSATPCATSAHPGPVAAAATPPALEIVVLGHPTPQGSKRAWVQGGRAMMAEQTGDRLRSWRQDVKAAAIAARPAQPITAPVRVTHVFAFPRPKSHYGSGRNAHRLKDSAPAWPTSRSTGDIEKLVRSTHDAITTAAVWGDDSQVVQLDVRKVYADGGCDVGDWILIEPLPDSVSVPCDLSLPEADTDPHAAALSPDAAPAPHPDVPHAVAECGAGSPGPGALL